MGQNNKHLSNALGQAFRTETWVADNLSARQRKKAFSQDSAGVASGQALSALAKAQTRAFVERPEDTSSQTLPIQSDGA